MPLLYVSDSQINAVAPQSATPGDAMTIHIVSNSVTSPDYPVTVIAADPEIFRNADGTAATVNQDGTRNSPTNPAKAGSIVSIWATGTGLIYPRPLDGQISTTAQDYACCQVTIAPDYSLGPVLPPGPVVFYAGAAPGTVAGVVQINFQIPAPYIHALGTYNFTLIAGGKSSATAAIYVTP
jgi:uncharacterized protein (TIGR03437 family)